MSVNNGHVSRTPSHQKLPLTRVKKQPKSWRILTRGLAARRLPRLSRVDPLLAGAIDGSENENEKVPPLVQLSADEKNGMAERIT